MAMRIDFFKEKIHEELEDAKEYMLYANETKKSHPYWANKFMKLGCEEMAHANHLMSVLDEFNNSEERTKMPGFNPDQYQQQYWAIMEDYSTMMPKITAMKESFYK